MGPLLGMHVKETALFRRFHTNPDRIQPDQLRDFLFDPLQFDRFLTNQGFDCPDNLRQIKTHGFTPYMAPARTMKTGSLYVKTAGVSMIGPFTDAVVHRSRSRTGSVSARTG